MKQLPSVYCFVRGDLPLHQQVVQVGHACIEAANAFNLSTPHNLIVLKAKDEEALFNIQVYLDKIEGLEYTHFYEPESIDPPGVTAICTNLVSPDNIQPFRRFKLPFWR